MALTTHRLATMRGGLLTLDLSYDDQTLVISALVVTNLSLAPATTTLLKPAGGVFAAITTLAGLTDTQVIPTTGAGKLTLGGWGAGQARGYGLTVV